LRGHGGSLFADLVDQSGKIQLFFSKKDVGGEKFSLLELLDLAFECKYILLFRL